MTGVSLAVMDVVRQSKMHPRSGRAVTVLTVPVSALIGGSCGANAAAQLQQGLLASSLAGGHQAVGPASPAADLHMETPHPLVVCRAFE